MVGTVLILTLLHRLTTGEPPTYLLGSPEVRQELGLTHESSLKIRGLLDRANGLNRGGFMTVAESKKLDEERKKFKPEELQRQAAALLTPAQAQRLRQLDLQRIGPHILNMEGMPEKLGVSAGVVARVQAAQSKAYPAYEKGLQTGHGVKANAWYKRECALALESNLTAEQKARLKALVGKPFDLDHLHYDLRSWPMG